MEISRINDGPPEPPEVLDKVGRDEWIRVCNELYPKGLLREIDLGLLTAYCMEMSAYYECKKIIAEKSYVYPIKDSNGVVKYIQQIPHVGIANKSLINAIKLSGKFYITPVNRDKQFKKQKKNNLLSGIDQ